jgi:hypothetical protein
VAESTDAKPRRGRRRLIAAIVVAAGLVAVWGVAVARVAAEARRETEAGRRAIDRVRAATSPADLVQGKPLDDLREAQVKFSNAHDRISGALLAPARLLPILGRQVRSASALTAAASGVADLGIRAVADAKAVLELPRRSGPDRVELLRRVASLSSDVERRVAAVRLGPDDGLLAPLAEARRELEDELARLRRSLRRGASAATAVADLLAGPRRVLLFAANNAEMRAGAGMFLAVAELETADGTLRLGPMRSIAAVPQPAGVPLEGDLAARWGWALPNREWTALMMSPRFEESAELASRMWQAATGRSVEGVLAVDPSALQAVLDATGPVAVGGRTYDAANVVEHLLHDQYEGAPSLESTAQRRDLLAGITSAAVAALNEGRWDPVRLLSRLADAARGRHVMAWAARENEQTAWSAAGVAGSLRADSLLVGILNRGGNKLDWFMRTAAELDFVPGNPTQATLRITLRNEAPASGEPSYVVGPHPDSGGRAGDYVGILAVNLPGSAGGARIDGVEQLGIVGGDGPTRVVGLRFILPRGQTRTFVVRFSLAGSAGSIRVEPGARIPPTTWRYEDQSWTDSEARTIEWRSR